MHTTSVGSVQTFCPSRTHVATAAFTANRGPTASTSSLSDSFCRVQCHSLRRQRSAARYMDIHTQAVSGVEASRLWPVKPPTVHDRVFVYQGLTSADFQHPLDQQNTSMLRSVPGLELVAKNFMGPVAEQVLLLENISSSIKIGPDQLPTVHKLLQDAAAMLQMEAPELYVRQNPTPNAYTLAITGRTPFIVVHTALLELLTPLELQAVLAHELGHLKCDHGLWLTVANVLASGTVSVLPVITGMVQEALMRWLRAAELTCDRAALLVAQEPKVVISALMKLAGGSPSFAAELNVEAFLQQARNYEEVTSSGLGWYLRNAQTSALSHPLPVMRAREVDRWGASVQYKQLLQRNRVMRSSSIQGSGRTSSIGSGNSSSGSGAGVAPTSMTTLHHASSQTVQRKPLSQQLSVGEARMKGRSVAGGGGGVGAGSSGAGTMSAGGDRAMPQLSPAATFGRKPQ